MNPCWTHLFERAKIMPWLVRIALYASLKFFMSNGLALVLHLYLFENGVLSIFEEMLSFFTYIYLRVSQIFKKFSLALLKLFWEKENLLCSWSSLIFVWAYEKQHMKISPKVIDVQEGYNKNFHEDHWTK